MKKIRKKTPLTKTDSFERSHGLKNVYVKDESVQPTGTIKDRRNMEIVEEAERLKVDKLVLITSGNNGYSLAILAAHTPIKVVCVVERTIDPQIIERLSKVAYQVIPLNLSEKILRTEEIIAFARERDDEVIWDVTNGYEDAYHEVAKEILKELPEVDYIVTPLGSGGIFVGFAEAIQQARAKVKIIGMGPKATQDSFADKLFTPWSPYTRAIKKYKELGHKTHRLTEQEIKRLYQLYEHTANAEPSATIVFGAIEYEQFSPDDTIVFLNSGKTKIDLPEEVR